VNGGELRACSRIVLLIELPRLVFLRERTPEPEST
jgi:hypothetical protein